MQDIKTNLIKCERALAPTGIDIAPYVINPYRGCGFGCIYCYSQKNKCFQKRNEKWGEFVDVKINCIDVLEKELKQQRPERILLGSTTEVYQQIEEKYSLTKRVIKLINRYNIPITILTKSSLILRDIDILHNAKICFTINIDEDQLIKTYERNSPSVGERIHIVKMLRDKGIYTYVHVGPVLPGVTDIEDLMELCDGITDRLDFESFNYWMSPFEEINTKLSNKDIFYSETKYNNYWNDLKTKILELNTKYTYKINFHFHPFKAYW